MRTFLILAGLLVTAICGCGSEQLTDTTSGISAVPESGYYVQTAVYIDNQTAEETDGQVPEIPEEPEISITPPCYMYIDRDNGTYHYKHYDNESACYIRQEYGLDNLTGHHFSYRNHDNNTNGKHNGHKNRVNNNPGQQGESISNVTYDSFTINQTDSSGKNIKYCFTRIDQDTYDNADNAQ